MLNIHQCDCTWNGRAVKDRRHSEQSLGRQGETGKAANKALFEAGSYPSQRDKLRLLAEAPASAISASKIERIEKKEGGPKEA